MENVLTLLMFEGRAEEAMNFYVSTVPSGRIDTVTRYAAGEPGPEGTIKYATFTLGSQQFACMDSPIKHAFTFTSAISIIIYCSTEAEVDELFSKLSEGGAVMMPLNAYPFSKRFAWITDRFGVSWQLNYNK